MSTTDTTLAVTEMTDWKLHSFISTSETGGLYVWSRPDPRGTIYQVSKEEVPPAPESGGFYKLEVLLGGVACTDQLHEG